MFRVRGTKSEQSVTEKNVNMKIQTEHNKFISNGNRVSLRRRAAFHQTTENNCRNEWSMELQTAQKSDGMTDNADRLMDGWTGLNATTTTTKQTHIIPLTSLKRNTYQIYQNY